jgi:hypothetical protein
MKTALSAVWAAVCVFFLLLIGIPMFSVGGLIGHGLGLVFLIPAFVITFLWLKVAWRRQRNAAGGVVMAWGEARMTSTELIDGYGGNAPRHPLAGLVALVSTSGGIEKRTLMSADGQIHGTSKRDNTRVHLTIRGPRTALVYTGRGSAVEAHARKFAAKLNAAGRQMQGTPPAAAQSAGTSAVPLPPPGWYPDPTGHGKSYWDGQAWHNQLQKSAAQLSTAGHQIPGTPSAAAQATQASASPLPSPGWYPDPNGGSTRQYWDGRQWHNATERR